MIVSFVLNGTNSDSGKKVLTCDYVFPAPYDKFNEIIDHDELIYEILADTRTKKSNRVGINTIFSFYFFIKFRSALRCFSTIK